MPIARILTSHRTEEMSRHYNHPTPERVLRAVQEARPLLEER